MEMSRERGEISSPVQSMCVRALATRPTADPGSPWLLSRAPTMHCPRKPYKPLQAPQTSRSRPPTRPNALRRASRPLVSAAGRPRLPRGAPVPGGAVRPLLLRSAGPAGGTGLCFPHRHQDRYGAVQANEREDLRALDPAGYRGPEWFRGPGGSSSGGGRGLEVGGVASPYRCTAGHPGE